MVFELLLFLFIFLFFLFIEIMSGGGGGDDESGYRKTYHRPYNAGRTRMQCV